MRLQLLEETGNELDRTHGQTAVAFAAKMLMATEEEFLDKEILEDAREELGSNMTDQRAVYACLRILLRGMLDRLLEEYDDE